MNTHLPQKEAPALFFIICSGEPLAAQGLLPPALVQHGRVEIQVNPLNPGHNPLREQLNNVEDHHSSNLASGPGNRDHARHEAPGQAG